MNKILVIGASSFIAKALVNLIHRENSQTEIHCVSRKDIVSSWGNTTHYLSDYSKDSIDTLAHKLISQKQLFDTVLFFNGQLHTETYSPEKKVSQFDEQYLTELVASNVLPHLFWYTHLHALLPKNTPAKIIVLSARIGSISDNRSGGWYSYRMTKSMLNMASKCYSIELARSHPYAKVILFHPGTTDTPLSQPFQKNIPKHTLFNPSFTADCMLTLINSSYEHNQIEYIDWQQQPIEW